MAGNKRGGVNARSAARLAAVQALYQMDLAKTELNAIIEEFTAFRLQGRDEENEGQAVELADADRTFFAELVRGAVRRQREIDPLVDEKLATGWRLVRVDSTLRAIFRAAVFELMERIDVPARVIINEYINVAHAFFSEEQPKVVNGLLDQLARELRVAEFGGKPGTEARAEEG
jgi:transcription antitermination protein NusB